MEWKTGAIRAYVTWAELLPIDCESFMRRDCSGWNVTDGEVIDPPKQFGWPFGGKLHLYDAVWVVTAQ